MAEDTGVPLMFSIFLGIALSLTVIIFAKFSGFDRDKSFYPTILIVIAVYYILFAINHIWAFGVARTAYSFGIFSHSGVWRI